MEQGGEVGVCVWVLWQVVCVCCEGVVRPPIPECWCLCVRLWSCCCVVGGVVCVCVCVLVSETQNSRIFAFQEWEECVCVCVCVLWEPGLARAHSAHTKWKRTHRHRRYS